MTSSESPNKFTLEADFFAASEGPLSISSLDDLVLGKLAPLTAAARDCNADASTEGDSSGLTSTISISGADARLK
ncbi:hypothetical protein ACHAWC_010223 [Mediolabrus comicus]